MKAGNLHPVAQDALNSLATEGYGPAWVEITRQSGKAQVLCLIEPVYTGRVQARNQALIALACHRSNAFSRCCVMERSMSLDPRARLCRFDEHHTPRNLAARRTGTL